MTNSSPPHRGMDGGSSGSRSVRDDVHQTVDDARQGAAGRVDDVAESIDAAADHLSQEDMTRLSGYVHDIARSLSGFSRDLRDKSGDEVLQDVKRIAHRNPALFLGGSVAIGFGLSRFARATRSRDRHMPVPMDQARPDLQPATGTASTSTSSTTDYSRAAASPSSPDYGDLP